MGRHGATLTLAATVVAVVVTACSHLGIAPSDGSGGPSSPGPAAAPPRVRAPAVAVLGTIPVKGRAPKTGYDRDEYGSAWTDDNNVPFGHNGCDTRNDLLRRDLYDVVVAAGTYGCVALSGRLEDPYTGRVIAFERGVSTSGEVQIDHVVALGDSWQSGAQQWSAEKRQDFANDPLNLLAVDGPTNGSKSDSNAASWLPPDRGFWCSYVARQTAVKAKYGLWMTPSEKAAIARVLQRCPEQRLPREPGRLQP